MESPTGSAVPDRYLSLLDSGENEVVDFKRTLPSNFNKKVMEACNTVGTMPSAPTFYFFVGVEERTRSNGTQYGVVSGLLEHSGGYKDFEGEKQRAIDAIRTVSPVPEFSIHDCQTTENRSFFVIELEGTGGPFHVDGVFRKRHGSHGGAPLALEDFRRFMVAETQEFLRRYEATRDGTEALVRILIELDEIRSETSRMGLRLQAEIDDLAYESVRLADLQRELRSATEEVKHEIYETETNAVQALGETENRLNTKIDMIEPPLYVLQRSLRDCRERFQLRWEYLEHQLPHKDDLNLASYELLDFFSQSAPSAASVQATLGELAGWQSGIVPAGTPGADDARSSSLSRGIAAALGNRAGLRQGAGWAEYSRNEDRRLAAKWREPDDAAFVGGIPEFLMIIGDAREIANQLGRAAEVMEVERDVRIIRYRTTVLKIAILEGSVVGECVRTSPEPELPESDEAFRRARRAMRRKKATIVRGIPTQGGLLATLAGERLKASTNR